MQKHEGVHIGFTGTHIGMTQKQRVKFRDDLYALNRMAYRQDKLLHFHHGDCVGGDAESHEVAKAILIPQPICIHIHPPMDPKARAYCTDASVVYPTAPYLVRNRNIVDAISLLFVAPRHAVEELRSGEWMTYRYAKRQMKDIVMLRR